MAVPAEDAAEIQVEEPAVEPFPRPIISRVKCSTICCYVIGPVGLGLMAGGCMGAMAAEMAHFLNATSQTKLIAKIAKEPNGSLKSTAYVTYMCLLVTILASAAGVFCGHQVYNLVKQQRWGEVSGTAFALAAPVAVVGMVVTGAALGTFPEKLLILDFPSFPVEFPGISLTYQTAVILIMLCLLLIVNHACILIGVFLTLLIACVLLFHSMTRLSGFVPLLDIDSIFPLFFVSMLITHKTPRTITTLLFIAMSILPYQDGSVPLDPAEAISSTSHVLKRLFVIVLAIQMFQASCGAVLYSDRVTDGAGKVFTSAVAASAGVLVILLKVASRLGTGTLLGVLLAASGATGVALNAAGDLGQRYGGHIGRAGAVTGAAAGAFLPLVTKDVEFGIMVALCAAAIPGSPCTLLCLDVLYHLHPRWHITMMCIYVPASVYVHAFFSIGIYIIVAVHFTIVFHRIGFIDAVFHYLLHTRLISLNKKGLFSIDQTVADIGAL